MLLQWLIDGTDRWTDTGSLHRPCSAYCALQAVATQPMTLPLNGWRHTAHKCTWQWQQQCPRANWLPHLSTQQLDPHQRSRCSRRRGHRATCVGCTRCCLDTESVSAADSEQRRPMWYRLSMLRQLTHKPQMNSVVFTQMTSDQLARYDFQLVFYSDRRYVGSSTWAWARPWGLSPCKHHWV